MRANTKPNELFAPYDCNCYACWVVLLFLWGVWVDFACFKVHWLDKLNGTKALTYLIHRPDEIK